MKWIWISMGAAAGYVLGTRAGREQFDRMSGWAKAASKDVGLSNAAEEIVGSARSAGSSLQDAATAHAQSVVADVKGSVTDRLDAVASSANEAHS